MVSQLVKASVADRKNKEVLIRLPLRLMIFTIAPFMLLQLFLNLIII